MADRGYPECDRNYLKTMTCKELDWVDALHDWCIKSPPYSDTLETMPDATTLLDSMGITQAVSDWQIHDRKEHPNNPATPAHS